MGAATAAALLVACSRGDADGALVLYGNVEVRDARLAFHGQDRIASVRVAEGDRVARGDLLATLDSGRLDAEIAGVRARIAAQEALVQRLENGSRPQEIDAARAALAAQSARAASLGRSLERLEATAERGASSAAALDDARFALEVARAEVAEREADLALLVEGPREEDVAAARATLAALRADLALLERRRADLELHAPADGVVESRILEPGEIASPDRPVLSLALTGETWIRAFVPEPELGRVAPGAAATVTTDSFGGRAYPGRVGFVSRVAEFTPRAIETEELRTRLVYEVRVLVDDPREELRLGQPVTVRIEASNDRDAPRADGEDAR